MQPAAAPVHVRSGAAAAQGPLAMPATARSLDFQSPYIARFAASGVFERREPRTMQRKRDEQSGVAARRVQVGAAARASLVVGVDSIRRILKVLKIVESSEEMLLTGTVTPHLTRAAHAIRNQAFQVARSTDKTDEYLTSLLWSIIADVTTTRKTVTAGDVADRIKMVRGKLDELKKNRSELEGVGGQLEKAGTMLTEYGDRMRRAGELLAAGWDQYSGATLAFRGVSISNAGGDLRLAGEAYKGAWTKIDKLYRWYSATESVLMTIYRNKISGRSAKPDAPGAR
jgi:hypothetical protein